MSENPSARVTRALAAVVESLGGAERAGQVAMAHAVQESVTSGQHLLVEAGTGTGKSFAYLVPAFLHSKRVVVATATLALQRQLVERDIPALIQGADGELPEAASYAVLKGRSNYACLHRVHDGVPEDQGTLLDAPAGGLGAEVVELREWAQAQSEGRGTGDRDDAPRHTDRAWRAVSVNSRECLGASRCSFGDVCFAEAAKERAGRSQVIVTNHSLLAIDTIERIPMIPDYDVVIVDEAHELQARVTQAATDELFGFEVDRLARSLTSHDADAATALAEAGDGLEDALREVTPGRLETLTEDLTLALGAVRDAARSGLSALPKESSEAPDPGLVQLKARLQEVFEVAARLSAASAHDVIWLTPRDDRVASHLCVAPLSVFAQLRDSLLAEKTVVFTSATLKLGGDFQAIARTLGLDPDGEGKDWRALDVGSPFDYGQQGILYTAAHLPTPGRDGPDPQTLSEIVSLIDAAQGRTLGLFSSRRAATLAAAAVREALPHLTILAQGEAQLAELQRLFLEDPHTCLFGTLGLWQGLDIPGDTCQLVLIDRIPFPRPDDPLMAARQRAADKAGANGFMTVAATHAALLLAQGAGRLIRRSTDRGVVAILDPRLSKARYGGFLRRSLPPMWSTTDGELVRSALRRLAATPSAS